MLTVRYLLDVTFTLNAAVCPALKGRRALHNDIDHQLMWSLHSDTWVNRKGSWGEAALSASRVWLRVPHACVWADGGHAGWQFAAPLEAAPLLTGRGLTHRRRVMTAAAVLVSQKTVRPRSISSIAVSWAVEPRTAVVTAIGSIGLGGPARSAALVLDSGFFFPGTAPTDLAVGVGLGRPGGTKFQLAVQPTHYGRPTGLAQAALLRGVARRHLGFHPQPLLDIPGGATVGGVRLRLGDSRRGAKLSRLTGLFRRGLRKWHLRRPTGGLLYRGARNRRTRMFHAQQRRWGFLDTHQRGLWATGLPKNLRTALNIPGCLTPKLALATAHLPHSSVQPELSFTGNRFRQPQVRYRPGFMTHWRHHRQRFCRGFGLPCGRRQRRLTAYIVRLRRVAAFSYFRLTYLTLLQLLRQTYLTSTAPALGLTTAGLITLNGRRCLNPLTQLYAQDFVLLSGAGGGWCSSQAILAAGGAVSYDTPAYLEVDELCNGFVILFEPQVGAQAAFTVGQPTLPFLTVKCYNWKYLT